MQPKTVNCGVNPAPAAPVVNCGVDPYKASDDPRIFGERAEADQAEAATPAPATARPKR